MPTLDHLGRAIPDSDDGLLQGLVALVDSLRTEIQVSTVEQALQAAQTAIEHGANLTTTRPLPVRVDGRPACTDGVSLWWTGFRSIDSGSRLPGKTVPASPDGQAPGHTTIDVRFNRQFLRPPEVLVFIYQAARLQAVPVNVTPTGFRLSVDNQTRVVVNGASWQWSWLAIEL